MVVDSGTKHWRWPWQRTCQGCGQQWPCFVVMARRASRRERRATQPCACVDCWRRREDEDEQASRAW